MKRILGLDIGVNSVGFGLVQIGNVVASNDIITSGVRIVNEDPDFHGKFYTGNKASKNSGRTLKRGIRRLNNRYKNRRTELIEVLTGTSMMPDEDLLFRISSLELYELRERALSEQISLRELGRVLYHLNQKRGFLSNRKSQSEEESSSEYLGKIKELEGKVAHTTIGSYFHQQLIANPFTRIKENIFPRKEYIKEFDAIWKKQKGFYPAILTGGPGESNRGTLFQRIRNEIIYYQRPLKSAKHLVSQCRFEPLKKVAPKSSPYFQVFRIWQQINNLEAKSPQNETYKPSPEQRLTIFQALHNPRDLSAKNTLTKAKLLKLMDLPKEYFLNYELFEGNKTYLTIRTALIHANVQDPDQFLFFNPLKEEEKGGLLQLWHITYSLPTEYDVIKTLQKHFPFSEDQARVIANKTGYAADFGSLSTKAIKKLLPHLHDGLLYDKACVEVGYNHSDTINKNSERTLKNALELLKPNTLRNPVVEQILNQVVHIVNVIMQKYGRPDEIRVELARELKNNAKQRQRITKNNKDLNKINDTIKHRLIEEHGFKRVNARDLLRYRLWTETQGMCIYSGKPISFADLYNGRTEIEHVLPRSRSFNNGMSNYIVAFQEENKLKGQLTAYDYMKSKGDAQLESYVGLVNKLFDRPQGISKSKRDMLLCTGEDIPTDFLSRQLKDTQYISREAVKMLREVCPNVTTSTGSITDFLREKWKLKHVMEEINLPKYRAIDQTEMRFVKDGIGNEKMIEVIKDFSKRDDHRHHAVDAIIVALTNQSIIQRLNNLNKEFETYAALKESATNFTEPIPNLRAKVMMQLENILISFKKPNGKVLTKKINRTKTRAGIHEQTTWVPRGALHEDTIMAQKKWYKKVLLDKKFNQIELIVNNDLKKVLQDRLAVFQHDPRKAFHKLEENPVYFNGVVIKEVVIWDKRFTKRVPVSEHITAAQIAKITDKRVKGLLETRINQAGSIKEAFREIGQAPIYLDANKTIPIKNVTVFDEGSLQQVRQGFVYTKGNHHAIIYTDGNGCFKEKVIPFWYAVEQCLLNLKTTGRIYPIIDRSPNEEGWKFYTSLQINDLFVLDLDPNEIDFKSEKNRSLIAQHLYRVQKISKGDYFFRHQYETTLDRNQAFALRRLRSAKEFQKATKITVNHIGEIIEFGK